MESILQGRSALNLLRPNAAGPAIGQDMSISHFALYRSEGARGNSVSLTMKRHHHTLERPQMTKKSS